MKRNATQRAETIDKDSVIASPAQQLNDLRLRVLTAKGQFLKLGTDQYTPFIEAEARREGMVLTADDKLKIRQVLNGRAFATDVHWVELIERAAQFQAAA